MLSFRSIGTCRSEEDGGECEENDNESEESVTVEDMAR